MMEIANATAWLVLAFGDDRSYGGNIGYEEDHTKVYDFDNKVQNHTQIVPGAIMLIRDKTRLLGAARVATVDSQVSTKTLRRCPECNTTKWIERKTLSPRYRCREGHLFDTLKIDEVPCIEYQAHFGTSYRPAVVEIPFETLRSACPNYADQVSIQRLQLGLLGDALQTAIPDVNTLLEPTISIASLVDDEPADPFVPNDEDRRKTVLRQLKMRRGQSKFREQLVDRYGGRCLVSGCSLLVLIEAAHISPYRGDDDNHPENGLLLRPDIHTLFDLDLLGIHPGTLEIYVHPELELEVEYMQFVGKKLRCGEKRPSTEALQSRWEAFEKRSLSTLLGSGSVSE